MIRNIYLIFLFVTSVNFSLLWISPAPANNQAGATSKNSSDQSSIDTLKSLAAVPTELSNTQVSDGELLKQVANLAGHGYAVIDRIRNDTDFPVDIFYNKTLHDLLPSDSVIRIKSFKKEYAISQAISSDESKGGATKQTSQAFRYLAARNLAGDWHLRADTIDPNDPATKFIVHKHLSPDLSSFIGIRSEVVGDAMLRAYKNNKVIFSKNSSMDFVIKEGQKSKNNFDSDFDQDSHWLIYAKGLKPTDPIDPSVGRYLDNLSLKNQNLNAFFSVRGVEDQKRISNYQYPDFYWHWVENSLGDVSAKKIDTRKWGALATGSDVKYEYSLNYPLKRLKIDRKNLVPFSGINGITTFFAAPFGKMSVRASRGTSSVGEVIGRINGRYQAWGHKRGVSRIDSILGDNPSLPSGISPETYPRLEQGLMIANHARAYEYMPDTKKVPSGSVFNAWEFAYSNRKNTGSIRNNIAKKKTAIHYGDKIKLVSLGSLLTLHAFEKDFPGLEKSPQVFGSHQDTASEYKKFNQFDAAFKKNDDATSVAIDPEDASWFYVKGPHKQDDRWNCQIGQPVQDGDIIRLEHVLSGRNVTVVRNKQPVAGELWFGVGDFSYKGSSDIVKVAKGANAALAYPAKDDKAQKSKEHELLVTLSEKKTGVDLGIGNSDDNFVVKFNEPVEANLNLGQAIFLVHQNTKHHLWSQHAFYGAGDGVNFGLVSALFPSDNKDTASAGWFILASEQMGVPVKDVVWCGVADGGIQDSAGDAEELGIEVVKLGLAGNLGPGQTFIINLPLYSKEPKISGFATDVVKNFDISQIVNLSSLQNLGIGWLEESLKTPNKATIHFRANAADNGDIQVYFGSAIGLDFMWKVVIGGGNNTSTYIVRRDIVGGVPVEIKVAEIFKSDNPAAGVIPGQYTPYWVSIDGGLVMVGVGQTAGENILLAWRDLAQRDLVNRIGFGSGVKDISYAEVQVASPLSIIPPQKFYFSQSSAIKTDPEGIVKINFNQKEQNLVFKIPGNSSMAFNISGSGQIFFFEDSEGKSFKILSDEDLSKKLKDEFIISLAQKVNKLKQSLGLADFFNATDVDDSATKNKMISFLVAHQDHILKKYVSDMSDEDKKKPENSFLLDLFAGVNDSTKNLSFFDLRQKIGEIVQKYIFSELKDPLITSLDIALTCAQIALGKKDFLLPTSVPSQTITAQNLVDPTSWISTTLLSSSKKAASEIENHYRLRIQDFKTISSQRFASQTKMKELLKAYCKELISMDLSTQEALQKAIIDKNAFLVLQQKTALGISITKTKEIEDRVQSNLELLRGMKDSFDENFTQIFSDPVILYLVQLFPELSDACLVFEKFVQASQTYNVLVSSRGNESSELDTSVSGGKNFWVAFDKGRFFLGQDKIVGKNLILYYWDLANPLNDVEVVGFNGGGNLSNVLLGNSPKFVSNEVGNENYSVQNKTFDYQGSLQIIFPYEYHLSQEDQQVKFYDVNAKKTIFPGKTPQQGALYYFTLILKKNGFPELAWTKEPENPLKLELQKRAQIHKSQSDTLFQASTSVQGMGALGGLLGVMASMGFAGGGIDQGNKAASMNAVIDNSFRSNDAYVFTDSIQSMKDMAQSSIPPEAMQNKNIVDSELSTGRDFTVVDSGDKLPRIISLYGKVLDLITHPYVISTSKEWFLSGIHSLYQTFMNFYGKTKPGQSFAMHQSLLQIFVKAYNNPYLIDSTKPADVQTKKTWFAQINSLAKAIMAGSADKGIILPPCFGEYIWLDNKFITPNKGSVIFKAKANNDLFVCFAENPISVRNTDKDIYEVNLGAFGKNENEKLVIRANSLGKAVAESYNPDGLLNAVDLKKYWISFNNGRIIVGAGDLDPNNALGQYDPATGNVSKVVWEPYSYQISLNKEWIKEVVGDDSGYYGKDFLINELQSATNENDKKNLLNLIADRKKKLTALFNKKIYPYIASSADQGFYRNEPFMWQDPYFDGQKTKITNVGLSNWNSEVDIQNVTISVAVEEIDFYLKNLYAQGKNNTTTADEAAGNYQQIFADELLAQSFKNKIYPILQQKRKKELEKFAQPVQVVSPENSSIKEEPSILQVANE